ncbi:MAG: hypothetical protein K0R75_848 [Paenibacillaceae bacterium]|nr:hypothetical protein [Paenibacillaceae bacterium]
MQQAFGKDFIYMKGKNKQSIFKYKNQPVNMGSFYDKFVDKELGMAADAVVKGDLDINTALRQAEENANKAIAASGK